MFRCCVLFVTCHQWVNKAAVLSLIQAWRDTWGRRECDEGMLWHEGRNLLFSSLPGCRSVGPHWVNGRVGDLTIKRWEFHFVKPACTAVLWRESASWLWREEVRILHRRVCEQQDDREDIELDCNNFDGQLKEEKGSWLPVSHTVSRNKWRAENICWRRLYRNRVVKFANTY